MIETSRPRRGRTISAAFVALVIIAGGVLVSPPLTAAALGCNIGPSLRAVAAREGISCETSDEGSGGGPAPYSPTMGPCKFLPNMNELTDEFLKFLSDPYTDHYWYLDPSGDPVAHPQVERNYRKNGQLTGRVSITPSDGGRGFRFWIDNMTAPDIHKVAVFDCLTSQDGFTFNAYTDYSPLTPHTTPAPVVPGVPMSSPSDVDTRLSVTDAMSPLPGRPGEYLLRVDLAKAGTARTAATVTLPQGWDAAELVVGPKDTSCSVLDGVQECFIPEIVAGGSATLVLHVTTHAASGTELPILLMSTGIWKMTFSSAEGPTWKHAPLTAARHIVIP